MSYDIRPIVVSYRHIKIVINAKEIYTPKGQYRDVGSFKLGNEKEYANQEKRPISIFLILGMSLTRSS